MLNITILYGAIRKGRLSIRAAKAIETTLKSIPGIAVDLIDLRDCNLPVMEERLKDMQDPPAGLITISNKLKAADCIVFVSPEYNNSYSGALKNAVDYFTTEWSQKPIAIATASSGIQGGINASNLLQLLVLAINGFAMPTKLLVPEIEKNLDENGAPLSERMAKSLTKFATDLVWFAEAIKTQKEKTSKGQ